MPIVVKLLSVIIASVIVSVVGVALLTGIEMSLVRENGNTVTELPSRSLSEFQDAMQPVYDKYASNFSHIIREIQNTK